MDRILLYGFMFGDIRGLLYFLIELRIKEF